MRYAAASIVFALAASAWAQTPPAQPAQPPAEVKQEAPKAAPQKPAVAIVKMAVGHAVQEREIVGEAASFDASVGRLYCWTKVKAETVPAGIKHVWYLGGKKVAEVPLAVKARSVRTWSSKSIAPGAWKVEAQAEGGEVLQSAEFAVTAEAAQPKK
jgi:hypothetical protein